MSYVTEQERITSLVVETMVGTEERALELRARMESAITGQRGKPNYRHVFRSAVDEVARASRQAFTMTGATDPFHFKNAVKASRVGIGYVLRGVHTTEQLLQERSRVREVQQHEAESAIASMLCIVGRLTGSTDVEEYRLNNLWNGSAGSILGPLRMQLRSQFHETGLIEPAPFDLNAFSLQETDSGLQVTTNQLPTVRLPYGEGKCKGYGAQTESGAPGLVRFIGVLGDVATQTVLLDRVGVVYAPTPPQT